MSPIVRAEGSLVDVRLHVCKNCGETTLPENSQLYMDALNGGFKTSVECGNCRYWNWLNEPDEECCQDRESHNAGAGAGADAFVCVYVVGCCGNEVPYPTPGHDTECPSCKSVFHAS